ncbi:MAG: hypothetical protein HYV59_12360 [Planctomycetes bacterium]|nr:hypothetical protein [Planctomycetota bacterium]
MIKQEKEMLGKYAIWQELFFHQDNCINNVIKDHKTTYRVGCQEGGSCSEGGCSGCSSCSPSHRLGNSGYDDVSNLNSSTCSGGGCSSCKGCSS